MLLPALLVSIGYQSWVRAVAAGQPALVTGNLFAVLPRRKLECDAAVSPAPLIISLTVWLPGGGTKEGWVLTLFDV
jgi:hypothetical protein